MKVFNKTRYYCDLCSKEMCDAYKDNKITFNFLDSDEQGYRINPTESYHICKKCMYKIKKTLIEKKLFWKFLYKKFGKKFSRRLNEN